MVTTCAIQSNNPWRAYFDLLAFWSTRNGIKATCAVNKYSISSYHFPFRKEMTASDEATERARIAARHQFCKFCRSKKDREPLEVTNTGLSIVFNRILTRQFDCFTFLKCVRTSPKVTWLWTFVLLGRYAVLVYMWLPTFRYGLSVPSSRIKWSASSFSSTWPPWRL